MLAKLHFHTNMSRIFGQQRTTITETIRLASIIERTTNYKNT